MGPTFRALAAALVLGAVHINCLQASRSPWAPYAQRPNIFLIFADDMGYDDISFHGSDQIPTPNIDALHAHGVGLKRYYTAPMCTPARSSMLTGRYPANVGMQHFVIANFEPWGLGLHEKLLPEYMREAGYATHLVGKWHAGFYEKDYAPNRRGYDSFFGCLGGYIDYYNHSVDALFPGYAQGFDIRHNERVSLETLGRYSTDLFTDVAVQKLREHDQSQPMFMHLSYTAPHAANPADPLQAPERLVRQFGHIRNEQRRRYAAMVASLDENIGRFVQAVDRVGMLDNSVIVFVADNGSPVLGLLSNTGSNYPFRGQKNAPWDGSARVAAAIWSPLILSKQRVSNELVHISDWLPTFAHLAGFTLDRPIDGVNQWPSLAYGLPSKRADVLVNLDRDIPYTSYVDGRWKYLNGTTINGVFDGWLSDYNDRSERLAGFDYVRSVTESATSLALQRFAYGRAPKLTQLRAQSVVTCNGIAVPSDRRQQCRPLEGPCLFDIQRDPCERVNLAATNPAQLALTAAKAQRFERSAAPARNQLPDIRSDPANFNLTWTYWYDLVGPRPVSTGLSA